MPGSTSKLMEIERLRGVAIVMAISCHFDFFLPGTSQYWTTGVDLFFVISGYVITLSLIRLLPDLTKTPEFARRLDLAFPALSAFFIRRAFRIYPVAILGLLLPLLFSYTFNQTWTFRSPEQNFRDSIAVLTGFYNYLQGTGLSGIYDHYWSLAIEEQFYLILPLAFLVLPSRNQRLCFSLLGIVAVTFIFRPYFIDGTVKSGDWYFKAASHRRFDGPLMGVAIALFHHGVRLVPSFPPAHKATKAMLAPFLICVLACIGSMLPNNALISELRHPLLNLSVIAIAGLLVHLGSRNQGMVLAWRPVAAVTEWLGARCYSLYLLHPVVFRFWIEMRHRLGPSLPIWFLKGSAGAALQLCLVVAAVLLIADLVHRKVELPFMRHAKHVTTPLPAQGDSRLAA